MTVRFCPLSFPGMKLSNGRGWLWTGGRLKTPAGRVLEQAGTRGDMRHKQANLPIQAGAIELGKDLEGSPTVSFSR
jgi:hypothetical protein